MKEFIHNKLDSLPMTDEDREILKEAIEVYRVKGYNDALKKVSKIQNSLIKKDR
ncbi:MAG: hypothetical protein WD512_13650 [Candidatus Paceibacterota bacterium]